MRLLIDILHPAHVHVFRNLAVELMAQGHEVRFTLREKECARDLLDQYGLAYEVLSGQSHGAALAAEFLQRSARLWRIVHRFQPHFLAGVMGPSIAVVGRLGRTLGIDHARTAIFYDTEMAKITNWFAYPLADYVCTPDCYRDHVRGNHVTYPSYHELAYLHPNRFQPNREIVRRAGVNPNDRYFLVRFVSYEASHDVGTKGLSDAKKVQLVRMLRERGQVLISSEGPLPAELEPLRLRVAASEIHHFLAFAALFVGESATMASECAVLGVPAVYVSPVGRGYTDEQETRYQLVRNFTGSRFASDWLSEVHALIEDADLGRKASGNRTRLLEDKMDATEWMRGFFDREYERHFSR